MAVVLLCILMCHQIATSVTYVPTGCLVAKLRCIGSSMCPEEAQNDLQRPQSPLRWMQLSLQIYDWT